MRLHEVGMRWHFGTRWQEVCHEVGMRWHEVAQGWHEVGMRLAQGFHKVGSNWLFAHHPIPNAKFQPITL